MGKITGTFEIVPIKGQKLIQPFEVDATVTTVEEVANQLRFDLKDKNVMVNGVPGTRDTVVRESDTVALLTVTVTERPKGS